MVIAHDSDHSHLGYESATRTFCMLGIKEHTAIRESGDISECETCNEVLRYFKVHNLESGVDRCPATTRAGFRCVRDPKPGNIYCASHSYLEQAAAEEAGVA